MQIGTEGDIKIDHCGTDIVDIHNPTNGGSAHKRHQYGEYTNKENGISWDITLGALPKPIWQNPLIR